MKRIILVARPRSGTHLLRELLGQVPGLWCFGEIFHNDPTQGDYLYWPYYARRLAEQPELAWKKHTHMVELWNGYCNFLAQQAQAQQAGATRYLATVNYNSLHSLDSCWRNLYDSPTFFKAANTADTSVIHLVRANVLRTLVSELRARQSGVWHLHANDHNTRIGAVHVDTRNLLKELETRELEITTVRRWLQGFGQQLELQYESLLAEGGNGLHPAVSVQLAKFLGCASSDFASPKLRRTAGSSLEQDVINFEEVCNILRGTRFESFLI